MQELDNAIVQRARHAVLDEDDELIVGNHHILLLGEVCRERAFPDSELVELIVSDGAATNSATATEPDEIDEPIAHPPIITSAEFHSMVTILTDYCQWQDCVTTDDLDILRMLKAKVADAATPSLKQASFQNG